MPSRRQVVMSLRTSLRGALSARVTARAHLRSLASVHRASIWHIWYSTVRGYSYNLKTFPFTIWEDTLCILDCQTGY